MCDFLFEMFDLFVNFVVPDFVGCPSGVRRASYLDAPGPLTA